MEILEKSKVKIIIPYDTFIEKLILFYVCLQYHFLSFSLLYQVLPQTENHAYMDV